MNIKEVYKLVRQQERIMNKLLGVLCWVGVIFLIYILQKAMN